MTGKFVKKWKKNVIEKVFKLKFNSIQRSREKHQVSISSTFYVRVFGTKDFEQLFSFVIWIWIFWCQFFVLKMCVKNIDEIHYRSKFHQCFCEHSPYEILAPKITKLHFEFATREKLLKLLLYKKHKRKTLMKLTAGALVYQILVHTRSLSLSLIHTDTQSH